ncbi:MAG: hypothetical protein WA989_12405 [Henriciella sp.]|uniref:hypothetical protein n=1 Tax=Henriciella sp. TaxID=1968823 RepID=UPI003C726C59
MRRLLFMASAVALAACGGGAPDGEEAGNADAPASNPATDFTAEDTAPEPAAPNPLDAGTYCYYRDDENVTEALEIEVAANGMLSGENYGSIHQEAAAYYASFTTELSNGLQGPGDEVMFDQVTEVDGDTQRGKVMWRLTPQSAAPDGLETLLNEADCDGLKDRVFPPIDEAE